MADGVEVRGKSIRIYFRYNNQTCREAFAGDSTVPQVLLKSTFYRFNAYFLLH